MESTKLIAFWKYDQFPYFLTGEVTRFDTKGNVYTKEYSHGYAFRPILVVEWSEELQNVLVDIKQLTNNYDTAKKELHDKMKKKILDTFPFKLDI